MDILTSVLRISQEETTFAKRGFCGDDTQIQQHLENIGWIFLQGYHAAIATDNLEALVAQLNTVEPDGRGFAFEGAAMGLALLDFLTPWKRDRLQNFLSGAGAAHIYMVYVGLGWCLARIPWGIERYLARLGHKPFPDPLLGWLAVDGYGFHAGYFQPRHYIDLQIIHQALSDDARHVFDQGLGRSLWFVHGADVDRIGTTIKTFHPSRQADLWSGVGLACTYAGGVNQQSLETLRILAGAYLPHLAQGAAFAAKARQRANNIVLHTEIACEVLCGMSVEAAATTTDIALEDLPINSHLPNYEVWRRRIQKQFTGLTVTAS
ncbi:Protein of unknown function (DUF1702) [Nostoc sp. PCC 7524]|uniref:DUF1702 family protein n=1 Tax=Nostoc sp. (strain ATCC 29411 / PCC 7524) TaxID=28072 RepID=UPI00029F3B03|nr:DUF1702 family protein [Nostoc sp. PCC 7524]AFY50963.1 Protein of unknown function (DUF1702) [Nostoc sp. PCC 7524]